MGTEGVENRITSFVCKECNSEFYNDDDLKKHIDCNHDVNREEEWWNHHGSNKEEEKNINKLLVSYNLKPSIGKINIQVNMIL